MFRKRGEQDIDIYEIVYNETNHMTGAVLKDGSNDYYFVTQDFDYEKYIVISEGKIEIYNGDEMDGLLNRPDIDFVKLIDIKDLEIIF